MRAVFDPRGEFGPVMSPTATCKVLDNVCQLLGITLPVDSGVWSGAFIHSIKAGYIKFTVNPGQKAVFRTTNGIILPGLLEPAGGMPSTVYIDFDSYGTMRFYGVSSNAGTSGWMAKYAGALDKPMACLKNILIRSVRLGAFITISAHRFDLYGKGDSADADTYQYSIPTAGDLLSSANWNLTTPFQAEEWEGVPRMSCVYALDVGGPQNIINTVLVTAKPTRILVYKEEESLWLYDGEEMESGVYYIPLCFPWYIADK